MISSSSVGGDWTLVPAHAVDSTREAVLGADLDSIHFARGEPVDGLALAVSDGVSYASGSVGGPLALLGPLSESLITIGLGLRLNPGSRQWLSEVRTGNICVVHPGDEHRGLFMPGSLYVTARLSADQLEEFSAEMGLVLDARQLGGSGVSSHRAADGPLAMLRSGFERVHRRDPGVPGSSVLGRFTLETVIGALAREPRAVPGARMPVGYGRIVARALDYIEANLAAPLSNRTIARAAFTSEATLHRAFLELFGETPQTFVRKWRLNRIRQDLASEAEARCTITMIANRWGVSELGRFAGLYRSLFGELPSETRARAAALRNPAAPGGQSPSP